MLNSYFHFIIKHKLEHAFTNSKVRRRHSAVERLGALLFPNLPNGIKRIAIHLIKKNRNKRPAAKVQGKADWDCDGFVGVDPTDGIMAYQFGFSRLKLHTGLNEPNGLRGGNHGYSSNNTRQK
jgi:hypothetical protein